MVAPAVDTRHIAVKEADVSPVAILAGLTTIANDSRWLAVCWHIVLATLVVMLLAGWRPSNRLLGGLLITPLVSVSTVAWLSGNPFNGITFAVLRTNSWVSYLYASPFGLLPCPTLAVVIGTRLLLGRLQSSLWDMALVAAALVYGAVGTLRLGVRLDWALLFASVTLAALALHGNGPRRTVRADFAERTRRLPGDDFILRPLAVLTHAITLHRPSRDVWAWLIQMGAGNRAGWYSYDLVDNGRRPSASRIVPELQHIAIGTVFPALPGETEGFVVLDFDPCRSLVLGWPAAGGEPIVTWAFVLEEQSDGVTRLIVRARGGHGYRFQGLPAWLSVPVVQLVHFVMERKQMLGIARRVEMTMVCATTRRRFDVASFHEDTPDAAR